MSESDFRVVLERDQTGRVVRVQRRTRLVRTCQQIVSPSVLVPSILALGAILAAALNRTGSIRSPLNATLSAIGLAIVASWMIAMLVLPSGDAIEADDELIEAIESARTHGTLDVLAADLHARVHDAVGTNTDGVRCDGV